MASYSSIPLEEGASPAAEVAVNVQGSRRPALYALTTIFLLAGGIGLYSTGFSRGLDGKAALDAKGTYSANCLSTDNVVLDGYDLVAYFSLDAGADGVAGSSDYTTTYGDNDNTYTFYFSTAANLALFEASPTSYLPQFGGFCSWGVAEEDWWTVDNMGPNANPDVWEVIDGKLYFFMMDEPRDKFMGAETADDLDSSGSTATYITDGSTNWEGWFDGAAAFNTGCYWYEETDMKPGDQQGNEGSAPPPPQSDARRRKLLIEDVAPNAFKKAPAKWYAAKGPAEASSLRSSEVMP